MPESLHYLHSSERPVCDAIVDKRFVGYAALQFVYRGGIRLSYNSKHYELQAPMVWPCNPGPHVYFCPLEQHWHHFHVAVTGPLLDQWRREGLWQQRRGVNRLEKILLDLLPEQTAEPEPEWLHRARSNLEHGLDQQAVAKKLGMGVSTFRRRFTDAVGVCPQDWLVQQRIDQARDLLLHTDTAIADIAEELQYCDPAHFARQFKQRVGLSPRAYRQSANSE